MDSPPLPALFPPLVTATRHERLLEEILEERVVSSRGRRNPRVVKRKMSNYPTKHRHKIIDPYPQRSIRILLI
jgi:hypothetical protein